MCVHCWERVKPVGRWPACVLAVRWRCPPPRACADPVPPASLSLTCVRDYSGCLYGCPPRVNRVLSPDA
eukprot:6251340-Prymnesium_polylepis.1